MTKPTGRPRGRPKTSYVKIFNARVPLALADRAQGYAARHRTTVSDLLREGLALRLEEPDERPLYVYVPEKASDGKGAPVPEKASDGKRAPGAEKASDGKEAYLAEKASDGKGASVPEHAPARTAAPEAAPDFDREKYILGKLCPRGHAHGTTGQSLLRISNRHCVACDRDQSRHYRHARRAAALGGRQGRGER